MSGLKIFGLSILLQILIFIAWLYVIGGIVGKLFDVDFSWPLVFFYLWPLFLLGSGGSMGGEIFLVPVMMLFYSAFFAIGFSIFAKFGEPHK